MKLIVCGGLDAPDWILAHMSTLSKISSPRIKILGVHIIGRMLEGIFEAVQNLSYDFTLTTGCAAKLFETICKTGSAPRPFQPRNFQYEKVLKLSTDSSLGESEVKACVAVLHFFIANGAKFDLDGSTLSKELQQLGLPKEHSDSLCLPFLDKKEALQTKFLEQSLQVPALKLLCWQAQFGELKSVVFRLASVNREPSFLNKISEDLQLCLTADKFYLLLHELKSARALMEELL